MVEIPGFGSLNLKHLVSDFTGTLSVDGKLLPGVKASMNAISRQLDIYVLTSDTFGTAAKELKGVACKVKILNGHNDDVQKAEFVRQLGSKNTVCIGNGNNDRKMLKIAALGIAIINAEGSATDAIKAADICVSSAKDGLDLLLNPKRIKATLRH